ncbi:MULTISPECIES: hypothetical protein [unclassified Archaeoglobus]|nr:MULTISPECIES: hypothetical protein [unclassified Archaeoglobus]
MKPWEKWQNPFRVHKRPHENLKRPSCHPNDAKLTQFGDWDAD